MTNFSRIEMAFEILKAMTASGQYYSHRNCSSPEKARAELAFDYADAFIEEAKKRGEA